MEGLRGIEGRLSFSRQLVCVCVCVFLFCFVFFLNTVYYSLLQSIGVCATHNLLQSFDARKGRLALQSLFEFRGAEVLRVFVIGVFALSQVFVCHHFHARSHLAHILAVGHHLLASCIN